MKINWCRLSEPEFIALTLIGKLDCTNCKHYRDCVEDYFGNIFPRIRDKWFMIMQPKNELPKHSIFCSHCRKDSGVICEYGYPRKNRYYSIYDNPSFLVCCKICKERWTIKISQYESKYKRKWSIKK